MQVSVTGKHVDVGDALRERVSGELSTTIDRYFERGGGADVVVSREGHAFKVDCAVTLASGAHLQTHGVGGDAHSAFDAARERMEKRIRRYKRKLKDHHIQAHAKQAETTAYFVLQTANPDVGIDEPEDEEELATAHPEPVVIAEMERPIRTLTVSMAAAELDLTDSPTIVFRNAAHGGLSVVYRRPDGNIGWIDPERAKANGKGANGSGANS
ncbi:MAG TPA: ribosome-associated translation inhibitor RaiA [Phenylobacterium sp.]